MDILKYNKQTYRYNFIYKNAINCDIGAYRARTCRVRNHVMTYIGKRIDESIF